jgi:hypothetical protein
VLGKSIYLKVGVAILAAAILAGCAALPESIAADDDALCRYSETAGGNVSYAQCRTHLDSQRIRVSAASASRIEGYALLQRSTQPTDVAGQCETKSAKNCTPDDVTGTIPAAPKR